MLRSYVHFEILYVKCIVFLLMPDSLAQVPYVVTKYGLMKGVDISVDNARLDAFLGIPYAQPPLRNLRFSPPKPPVIPPGYIANKAKSACPHLNSINDLTGTEDCLYLNIYVPKANRKPPVFIWINSHGSFTKGDAMDYDAEILASRGKLVVVTFNYRLGILGFLSSGDDVIRGNFGLKDQRMAIKWIRDNIESFGGDSSRITVCGLSSGAASVGFHMLNSKSKNLFHRAIMQSGGSTSSWSINHAPRETFLNLAVRVDCYNRNETTNETATNLWETARCMRTRTVRELLESDLTMLRESGSINSVIDKVWSPVIDGEFIFDDPTTLISNITYLVNSGFYHFDLLTGVTQGEGKAFYYDLVPAVMTRLRNPFNFKESTVSRKFFLKEVIPSLIEQRYGQAPYIASEALLHRYDNLNLSKLDGKEDNVMQSIGPMLRSYEDSAFVAPVVEQSRRHASHASSTYMYLLNHRTQIGNQSLSGLSNSADALYLFGLGPKVMKNILVANVSENDRIMSAIIIKYWSNFAKTGNTNLPDITVPTKWPTFESVQEQYIILSTTMTQKTSIGKHLYSERADFWIKYLPKLYKLSQGLPTSCDETNVNIVTPPGGNKRTTPTPLTTTEKPTTTSKSADINTTSKPTIPTTQKKETVFGKLPTFPTGQSWNTDTSENDPSAKCKTVSPGLTGRFKMDVAMAETTIISLIAVSSILGLLSCVVSCMLCARRRSDPDMGKF